MPRISSDCQICLTPIFIQPRLQKTNCGLEKAAPEKKNDKSELDIKGCQLLQKLLPKTKCRSEKKRKKINTKSGLDLEKQGIKG